MPSRRSGSKPRKRFWTREEAILALDLYFNHGLLDAGARQELSRELREWPVESHLAEEDPGFRNASSVRSKLYNFLFLDTEAERGREKGGEVTAAVWEEFGRDASRVAREADSIRSAIQSFPTEPSNTADDDPGVDETGVVLVVHLRRERDASLARAKKQRVLAETGALACEACGFDSAARFGIVGVIDCHHVKPLAELAPAEKTKLADLRLLCPTCHRLAHKRLSLEWDEFCALVGDLGTP